MSIPVMSLPILYPDIMRQIVSYIKASSDLRSLLLTSSEAKVTLLPGLKELEFTRAVPLSKLVTLLPSLNSCVLSGTILVDIPIDSVQWDEVMYKDLTLSLTAYFYQPALLVPLFQAAMKDLNKRLTVYDHKDILLGEALEGYTSDYLRYNGYYNRWTMPKYPLQGEKQLKHYYLGDEAISKRGDVVDSTPKALWIRGNWTEELAPKVYLPVYPALEYLKADCPLCIYSWELGAPKLRELGPTVTVYNYDKNYILDHPCLRVLNIRANSDEEVKWALKQRYDIVLWGCKRLLPLYRERYSHEYKIVGIYATDCY